MKIKKSVQAISQQQSADIYFSYTSFFHLKINLKKWNEVLFKRIVIYLSSLFLRFKCKFKLKGFEFALLPPRKISKIKKCLFKNLKKLYIYIYK